MLVLATDRETFYWHRSDSPGASTDCVANRTTRRAAVLATGARERVIFLTAARSKLDRRKWPPSQPVARRLRRRDLPTINTPNRYITIYIF